MADRMEDRIDVKLIGIDTLPADGREWTAVKRVMFAVEVDGRAHDNPRAPGFVITVPISATFFDDSDLIPIARGRVHEILKAAADMTADWATTEEEREAKRLPASRR